MIWHKSPIKKVAHVESGFGFPRQYQGVLNAEIPFYKVGDMNLSGNESEMRVSSNTISKEVLKTLRAKVFPPGTVIFPKIGAAIATNKKRILTIPSVVDNNIMGLIPKKVIDSWFLFYWMQQFDLCSIANLGPVPSMRKSEVQEIKIPLPTISEQRRIVEILDQAHILNKQRSESTTKAAQIVPLLFYQIFGDPITNPYGLKKEPLKRLIKVKSGKFLNVKSMDSKIVYPVYGGNGINGYHSEFMFEEPVIILGRVGAYCGAVHYSKSKCWITDNALYISDKSDELIDRYLVEALRFANLNQFAGRAGQPLISADRIYPVEILVPDPQLQERFAAKVEVVEETMKAQETSFEKIQKLFDVLLLHAFSGELTAKWRQAHVNKLLQEMEHQAKMLENQRP